jgi:nucleoside 2-deoxyribosyltransferase
MHPEDVWSDPGVRAFLKQAQTELLPMIKDSAVTAMIAPGDPDAKVAVELGFTILLDKPLIVLVPPDREVPERLRRAADAIVSYDPDNMEAAQGDISAALTRLGLGG